MKIEPPHVGQVINFGFLWKEDSTKGVLEGKNRPCCIVAAVQQSKDGQLIVMVVPITHSKQRTEESLKIPSDIKKLLGLDSEDQWVVCNEINKFIWPGTDLAPINTKKPVSYTYGTITSGFFKAIKTKMRTMRGDSIRLVSRSN